jgi:hypothetical protein
MNKERLSQATIKMFVKTSTGISQSPEKCAFSVNFGALKNFSRINHDKPATKVEDQLLNATLFAVEMF